MLCYYLIIDTDVALRNIDILESTNIVDRFFFGMIRNMRNFDYIPVLFNEIDVDILEERLRDVIIMKYGYVKSPIHTRAYPVFGFISLCFDFDGKVRDIGLLENKEYSKLESFDKEDMTTYEITSRDIRKKRGVVHNLDALKLVKAKYYTNIEMPKPIGFSILNQCRSLTNDDLEFLHLLYQYKNTYVDIKNDDKYKKTKKTYLFMKKNMLT